MYKGQERYDGHFPRCDNCGKPMGSREVARADSRSKFIWFCDLCIELADDAYRSMSERYGMYQRMGL